MNLTKEQKIAIKRMIEVSEEFETPRILIDYVGLVLSEFSPGVSEEYDKFITEEFRIYKKQ